MTNRYKEAAGMRRRKRIRINTGLIVPVTGAVMMMAMFLVNGAFSFRGVGGFESYGEPIFKDEVFTEDVQEEGSENTASKLFYRTYQVKAGDIISKIAEEYNVSQDTILSVNDIHSSRRIQIGQYLKIPSIEGVLYTVQKDGETFASIAEKYDVNEEECAAVNAHKASLKAGETVFVPGGALDSMTLREINGDLFRKPLHASYYLSSPYGWRNSPFSGRRSFHSGIDMAAPTGTAIYAALPGQVTFTGYNSIYGNYVIITHHSGYKTLYGHMSSISVQRGSFVDCSTRIGRVGSTGMSTGSHLHFTIFRWGKTVNPLSYITN